MSKNNRRPRRPRAKINELSSLIIAYDCMCDIIHNDTFSLVDRLHAFDVACNLEKLIALYPHPHGNCDPKQHKGVVIIDDIKF